MNNGVQVADLFVPKLTEREEISLVELEERVVIKGPSPISTRLSMLLSLCFAGNDMEHLAPLLGSWGWLASGETLKFFPEPLNNQSSWSDGSRARLQWAEQNQISLTITLRLSSSWMGWIRSVAMKQPEIIQAMMLQPTIQFRFSLLFDSLFSNVALNYSDFVFGEHAIHLGEKPHWLGALVHRLQGSFCCARDVKTVPVALSALLSVDSFSRYQDFCQSLSSYGSVRVAEIPQGCPMLLIDEEPLSFYGWNVSEAARQAAALHLSSASIVWIDGPLLIDVPDNVQVWTTGADGATLGKNERANALRWPKK